MTVVDRRKSGKNKSVPNRQKFIKRYKSKIKRSIGNVTDGKGITDVLKDRKVIIDDIDEPSFDFDLTTGERDIVLPGNKNMQKGDKIERQPPSDESGTEGSDSGDGFDEFSFTLTKEEFLDLYFSDMELPDFIKESLKGTTKHKLVRTGYSKDGIPPRLDLVKTLKQAMARRISTRSETTLCPACWVEYKPGTPCTDCHVESSGVPGNKPQRYLDDLDLRYKHFTKKPFPIKQATMILLMDVSYSMGEWEKNIAKKFFLLLYLFLHKVYKQVDVIFVSHTQEASEVTEHEFFYGTETGGTVVSSGLQLVKDIIDSRINLETTNVYISQASDGDTWPGDGDSCAALMEDLLAKVQYFAYVQTESVDRREYKEQTSAYDLMSVYAPIAEQHKNLQVKHVDCEADVYPVLRELFERS